MFDTYFLVRHSAPGGKETARRRFSAWVGEYGSMPGARITLTDEQHSNVLMTWPDSDGNAVSR